MEDDDVFLVLYSGQLMRLSSTYHEELILGVSVRLQSGVSDRKDVLIMENMKPKLG